MRATGFEFRFRVAIICTLYFLGFYAPWARLGSDAPANPVRLWSWLSLEASRTGLLSVGAAYLLTTIVTVAMAIAGAALRVWGTAYLGHFVVRNRDMKGGSVVAAGPYRHLRNPLYLGMLMTSAAVSVLMPASGALFFLIGMMLFTLRLIGGEEAFLSRELGEPYLDYRKAVPSILPSLQARLADSAARPKWMQGALAECFPVATAACFAGLAWSYDAALLTQCILVCFGGSLIVHALISTRGAKAV